MSTGVVTCGPDTRGVPKALRLLIPSARADSVTDIDPGFLRSRGIRGVILDLDNTLAPWHGGEADARAADWVRRMAAEGFRLCIASNTRRLGRLQRLAGELGVAYVTRCQKPRRGGFLAAMECLGTAPSETAVVGDQIFTDVLGGNRLGLLTVLTQRLSGKEFAGTHLSRLCEKMVCAYLRRRGLWG